LQDPFEFSINHRVVISWAFLGLTLLSSLVVFPLVNYCPPRKYAYFLLFVYLLFLVASVLAEVKVL
jgi:hypothetical protein